MTLQQFLMILWARRRLIRNIFLTVVLATLVVSLLLPKRYTATATVVVDVKSPDPIAGMVLPAMMTPGYMATQVDIINSARVAQRVAKMLRLGEIPVLQEQWREETGGNGDMAVWLADLLQENLSVRPSRESNVIEINFSGVDPEFSAAIANAFAQSFIDTSIELRVDPAKQYASWFDSQIQVQRDRLEVAQKALSDYQQANGIVITAENLDYEVQKLNELSAQLTLAQTMGADAVGKQKAGGADTLPEVIQNPLINQLKADVARQEAALKQISGNLGENHPQRQRAEAELATMKAQLRAETGKVIGSISTAGRVSVAKEKEINAAIERQKQKVLGMKKERDEASVLVREVDAAQRAFDAVGERMTQSRLESQSIQTNVSVLTPAAPPVEHSKPKIALNVVISMFLGTMLAVGTAFLLELARRRIRSTEDLYQLVELPVLAEIPSTRPARQQGNRLGQFKALFNRKDRMLSLPSP